VKVLEEFILKHDCLILKDRPGVTRYGCLYGSFLQVAEATEWNVSARMDLPDLIPLQVRYYPCRELFISVARVREAYHA
jgi:hypothetical protein